MEEHNRKRWEAGCRCAICVRSRRTHREKLRRLYPHEHARADVQEVREYLLRIQSRGMGTRRLAEITKVSRSTITRILQGRCQYVAAATARALLSRQLFTAPPAALDGIGVARRLQALTYVGWSASEIARRLGMDPKNIGVYLHGARRVSATKAEQVALLYEELWHQLPPANTPHEKRAVTVAQKKADRLGWLPPLCWDEETIDDPNARPVGVSRRKRQKSFSKSSKK